MTVAVPAGQLLDAFFRARPASATSILEQAPVDDIARLFDTHGPAAAVIFPRLNPVIAAQALGKARDETIRALLEACDPSRILPVLARLDADALARCLALVRPAVAKEIRDLLQYPINSAGAMMDPRVIVFRAGTTVEQALERIRDLGRKRINDVFLVDEEGRHSGTVRLQDLVTGDRAERLEALASGTAVSVQALAGREEVVEAIERHRLASLPVVLPDGRLLGVIRHDALVRVAEQEVSADMQMMVGASRDEQALSPVYFAIRKRLPWLQVNLLTAFLAASVVGLFEDTIARFTALAVLLPVVAGQSGNTGAQSLAVTMRGLTLREIRNRHWPKVAFKEASVGTINGLAVALTTSLAVLLWSRSLGLTLVIGLAMVASMAMASVAGALVPVVLSTLGQDPAQSSSIILTTITDIAGFFSFLGLATLMSHLL